MVKFKAEGKGGRPLYGLGLTEENVKRLVAGNPIHIHGEQMGFGAQDLMIFFGKDEEAIKKDLSEFIGTETEVREDGIPQ